MLSFALHKAWADRPLDADGKPLPPNMAVLIGKKFKALPIDPKLGDKSPVLPEIAGWRFVLWGESDGKAIIRNRLKPSWIREHYQRQIRNLSEIKLPNVSEKYLVCEMNQAFAMASHAQIAIVALKYCTDETFEIIDLLPLPHSFGVVTTRQVFSKEISNSEYQIQKKKNMTNNTGFAFLPSKYFQRSFCPFYSVFDIDIENNQGKSYILNNNSNKFQRDTDTTLKAANPNVFCEGLP
jgi:hypothetical protein